MKVYYPNGKKYKEICKFRKNQMYCGYKIVNAWDSNGVQTLKNGTGYYTEHMNGVRVEKQYIHYRLTGTERNYRNDKLERTVVYRKGKIISCEAGSLHITSEKRCVIRRYKMVNGNAPAKKIKRGEVKRIAGRDYAIVGWGG